MCKLSYQTVRNLWLIADYRQHAFFNLGVYSESTRYGKLANYLYDKMFMYSGKNVLLTTNPK